VSSFLGLINLRSLTSVVSRAFNRFIVRASLAHSQWDSVLGETEKPWPAYRRFPRLEVVPKVWRLRERRAPRPDTVCVIKENEALEARRELIEGLRQ